MWQKLQAACGEKKRSGGSIFSACAAYDCHARRVEKSTGRAGRVADANLVTCPTVPGEALPGERARRRAVEGHTKAGVPVATGVASQAGPAVTLEIAPRRLGRATSAAPPRVGGLVVRLKWR